MQVSACHGLTRQWAAHCYLQYKANAKGPSLHAAIPVWAANTTRVKALGLPIAALLLSTLPATDILFIGDSSHVIDCISGRCRPPNLFLHHCMEMCHDLLPNRLITMAWVPQDLNTVCDALARRARLEGLQLTIAPDLQPYAANWKVYLEYLCSLFSRMGGI